MDIEFYDSLISKAEQDPGFAKPDQVERWKKSRAQLLATGTKMDDKKLQQLLFYAKHGYPIFPLFWMNGGKCTCGKNCTSPGKHPHVSGGFKSATTDIDQVKKWHADWPEANWGMRTGDWLTGGGGVLVIDIDKKSGGFETWEVLRSENPGPIETVSVATGNGGQHLWFAYPAGYDIRPRAGVLGPGIDVRGNDGYVVVPPSKTTGEYRFELNPLKAPISVLPEWILHGLNGGGAETTFKVKKEEAKTPAAQRIGEKVDQGQRHQALTTVAGALRRVGLEGDEIRSALEVIRDERFADGDHPVTDEEIDGIAKWADGKARSYALTDLGNAERFLDQHQEEVRFCFTWDSWLAWDKKRWKVDDTAELIRRAHGTVRSIYSEATRTKDEDARKAIARHAVLSEARSRVENMLHSAKPYVPILPDELDRDPMLLNVRNGAIDLRNGNLLPHEKKHNMTKLVDVDFDPDAKCPKWENFIDLVTADDNDLALFLQKAAGY